MSATKEAMSSEHSSTASINQFLDILHHFRRYKCWGTTYNELWGLCYMCGSTSLWGGAFLSCSCLMASINHFYMFNHHIEYHR